MPVRCDGTERARGEGAAPRIEHVSFIESIEIAKAYVTTDLQISFVIFDGDLTPAPGEGAHPAPHGPSYECIQRRIQVRTPSSDVDSHPVDHTNPKVDPALFGSLDGDGLRVGPQGRERD